MNTAVIRPMLAAQKLALENVKYPCWIQPKLDGIRARAENGVALSRTNKPIPNKFISDWFAKHPYLHGLDGELGVVSPFEDKWIPFNDIQSAVMSEGGEPNFQYCVFDVWNDPAATYAARHQGATSQVNVYRTQALDADRDRIVMITPTSMAYSMGQLLIFKDQITEAGYEGAIIRYPNVPYKYGRSSMAHGGLIKFKDFVDDEATVKGFEELMHNDNEAKPDAFGLTKRSSHKANQRPGGMLGKLVVYSPKWSDTFKIGSGFDMALRQEIWDNRDRYVGKTVTFKYQPHGMKNLPRSPIFKGFRHSDDIGEPK